ncbi:hypothetical protein QWJ90_05885 [Microbacterium oryzae]|uniref:hypothetical protein n=1 Tax=Microbacterium oryzae TaxID=743009 RepID=UPI0025B24E4C|nr:hypothetical protein [Microbacterium oryzae]MDN3310452.1 hypothetical protein [Microbacterium oryzae]
MTTDGPHRRNWPGSSHLRALADSTRFFAVSVVVGFLIGLATTVYRRQLLAEQFNRDANRIYNIASGRVPDFQDGSYTPVGLVYRALGLATAPDVAAVLGYLLASFVIVLALLRSGRRTASLPVALYIVASFLLAGVYLGQYSKDVFVLLPVALLVLLPAKIWWDAVAVVAMFAYAFFFRDYWAIVAVMYLAIRVILIRQVRVRYLVVAGSMAAVAIGLAFFFALGVDPNHFRTAVQGHLEANTLIVPLEPFAQPLGGAADVFLNYWLLYVPVLLPFLAGAPYVVVVLGFVLVKVLPLYAARSRVRWPASREGARVRRALALILAFSVVQAVFEPDYGSALRHFTPLMALGLVVLQGARSGHVRSAPARAWSWSGAAAVDASASHV